MIKKFKEYLYEVADQIMNDDYSIYINWEDKDSLPFGIDYEHKLAVFGEFGSTHSDNNQNLHKYWYIGRMWLKYKVISFWDYPDSKDELYEILKIIRDSYFNDENIQSNIDYEFENWKTDLDFDDGEWKIEIVEIVDDEENYILIPINTYMKSSEPNEELKKLHLMDSKEKKKVLDKLGYKSKKSKWKKYMKPFESFDN